MKPVKPFRLPLALIALTLSGPVFADAAFLARADVQRYIDEEVAKGEFDRPALEAVFANVELKPNVMAILDRPSTSRPWYQFRKSFWNEPMFRDGVAFWKNNEDALARASAQYGVPPEMLVAILGIETHYGRNTGSFRVADVLATLGFDYPRRAAFFRKELTELLLLAREERLNPLLLKGSYAGAMGLPQFMPSSFRKWAVDFDGSGHRDIWNNPHDAIGSVANYFGQHGWIAGDDVLLPASVAPGPEVDRLLGDKFNLRYTIDELRAMGVTPDVPVNGNVKAVLVALETSPGVTEYWLGLNNFYVITRYNKSTLYAKVATDIARELKSRYLADRGAAAAQ
ncbi:lytic murein transglycosylase B [Paludibacterium paludis]|uniref:Murein transglycosylase n=1 Tax=Paludibacterium paludis TaxID=1225769 RepID=A0A918UAY2_9NEIS|nr:lytic murein transglycosylase B [Paludibacterium paludis]GGY19057.1 murein transglycosylase [Paludibacterium paludis]